jgi:hypothetical protein
MLVIVPKFATIRAARIDSGIVEGAAAAGAPSATNPDKQANHRLIRALFSLNQPTLNLRFASRVPVVRNWYSGETRVALRVRDQPRFRAAFFRGRD